MSKTRKRARRHRLLLSFFLTSFSNSCTTFGPWKARRRTRLSRRRTGGSRRRRRDEHVEAGEFLEERRLEGEEARLILRSFLFLIPDSRHHRQRTRQEIHEQSEEDSVVSFPLLVLFPSDETRSSEADSLPSLGLRTTSKAKETQTRLTSNTQKLALHLVARTSVIVDASKRHAGMLKQLNANVSQRRDSSLPLLPFLHPFLSLLRSASLESEAIY